MCGSGPISSSSPPLKYHLLRSIIQHAPLVLHGHILFVVFGSHLWLLIEGISSNQPYCVPQHEFAPCLSLPPSVHRVGIPSFSNHYSSPGWLLTPVLLFALLFLCLLHFITYSLAPLGFYLCMTPSYLFRLPQRCLRAGGSWMWAALYGSRRT